METIIASMDAFFEELRVLDLLSPEATERATSTLSGYETANACAERLIAGGFLTDYQAAQVLAGKGRRLCIGPYVLRERLGRGGMGHVYKAQHRWMKRVVALKLVSRLRRGEETKLNRFRREVEAAGRVSHPNIVTAYDAGSWRGRLYLAMEFIEGVDLERLVEDTGPLSVDLACEIIRQTAEALHHAHMRGLVHRDIKPSNLMLAPPGVRVKLLDLGLAQCTGLVSSCAVDGESDPELCGTPDFMAPESAHATKRADVRGDLYSLGCTFYFLLGGQVPYPGGSWTEKLLRHSFDAPVPLLHLRPDVPPEVASVVERLMAREAKHRHANAAEVAAEIAALSCEGLAIPKSDNNVEDKLETWRPRSPSRVTRFSIAVLVAMLLGVAVAGGARWMVATPATHSLSLARTNEPPFRIAGRAEGFPSLAKAIEAARDGEIITIHSSGPFVLPPLSWNGKALTLRAATEVRPRLEMKVGDDPWQALLQTDRSLTLEGLDLAISEDKEDRTKPCQPAVPARGSSFLAGAEGRHSQMHQGPVAPLIRCEQAPLYLTNCRLIGGAEGAAISTRNSGEVVVRGCGIEAGTIGLSVEVGQGGPVHIRIEESRLRVRENTGAALSLWAAEVWQTRPVEMELHGNTIEAGRVAALRERPATLTITARGNRFRYREALLSYSGFAKRDAWRDTVWQGGGNSYQGPASWLWVEGKPIALSSEGCQSLSEPRP